jgi:Fibronectin type III domain
MPTITQLPPASSVSPADVVPISQGGSANAASVGALLLAAQPVITVPSPSLLGRTSLGSGGPEPISVGVGLQLSEGIVAANGADHATYPSTSGLSLGSNLVISNQGSQMLMPTQFLRGLFSPGQNISIDGSGVISTTASGTLSPTALVGSAIGSLQVVSSVTAQDLVPISQAGTDHAVTYAKFLDGITIDQAPSAGPSADSDTIWLAQSTNVMGSQSLGAIWVWIAGKLPTYKLPVVEITSSINLDTTVHNGRFLVCSQPVTLTPLAVNMGSGFSCQVVNLSSGNVTLGGGFLTSTGGSIVGPQQTVSIWCLSYSGGTVVYASMPQTSVAAPAIPGQVTGLAMTSVTATTLALSWQQPSSGGAPSLYTVQFRSSGSTVWTVSSAAVAGTSYSISGLQPSTSYDVEIEASNQSGTGTASQILTVSTTAGVQASPPAQVAGLVAAATSSSSIGLSWSSQTGTNAPTSYTVQYRTTGATGWTSSISGISGTSQAVIGLQAATSYDFCVSGVNANGTGTASLVVSAATAAVGNAVTSITWNMVPSGPYALGSGTIGVNAYVSPSSAAVQFGFSTSSMIPATLWTAALHVNSNVWGAYVPIPATAGTWYAWVEGTDGSCPTVFATSFVVQ